MKIKTKGGEHPLRWLVVTGAGVFVGIVLILVTLEISRRYPASFVATQQRYIIFRRSRITGCGIDRDAGAHCIQ